MWKLAGSYSMTGVRSPCGRLRGTRNATTGSRAGSLSARMPDGVFGKKVVERFKLKQLKDDGS